MHELELPRDYDSLVKTKLLTTAIVNNKSILIKYFSDIGDYKGPFRKTNLVKKKDLIEKCAEIGVTLSKVLYKKVYYITENKKENVILFDPQNLDLT